VVRPYRGTHVDEDEKIFLARNLSRNLVCCPLDDLETANHRSKFNQPNRLGPTTVKAPWARACEVISYPRWRRILPSQLYGSGTESARQGASDKPPRRELLVQVTGPSNFLAMSWEPGENPLAQHISAIDLRDVVGVAPRTNAPGVI
jgi:hypothetical protein